MSEQITLAIVLFAHDYGESDKIVTFMSQNWGKMRGIAKGAKRSTRRFVNVLEPFTHVRLRFRPGKRSDLIFVVACELLDPPRSLAQDLDKFAAASYLTELTDKLVVGREAGEEVYALLRDGLFALDRSPFLAPLLLVGYELHLLTRVGYAPHLSHCQSCGLQFQDRSEALASEPVPNITEVAFSPRNAGVMCTHCWKGEEPVMKISRKAVGILLKLQESFPPPSIALPSSPLILREVKAAMRNVLSHHLPAEPKSLAFLERIHFLDDQTRE